MKQQLRIMLSPEALKRVSLIAQKSGLTISQIVEDSLMRTSMHQARIVTASDYKKSKKEFMEAIRAGKEEVINS
jgi:hypothetical protein